MKKALLLILLIAPLQLGCALFGAAVGAIPTVIQIVQDALIILDIIDATAKPFFERARNDKLLEEYNSKMIAAKRTLTVALRASEGGRNLSDAEIDAAFDAFRDAYKELLALLRDHDLLSEGGLLKVGDAPQIQVDEPLALRRK